MTTDKVKRYVVFAGSNYYPCGGWDDFVDSFATPEEAQAEIDKQEHRSCWAYAIDLETGDTIAAKDG